MLAYDENGMTLCQLPSSWCVEPSSAILAPAKRSESEKTAVPPDALLDLKIELHTRAKCNSLEQMRGENRFTLITYFC